MTITTAAAARTHIGHVRKRNEDAVYAGRSLFAVADGMGGHVAGDVASNTVMQVVRTYDREVPAGELADVAGDAVAAAGAALRARVETEPGLVSMGTTLVALWRSGMDGVLVNVGDSRGYLLRDGQMAQITEDHIYGNLVADAASVPSLSERLTRYLDAHSNGRSADITRMELRPADRFLLCTDGLTGPVSADLIRDVLAEVKDPEEAAEQLVTLALEHGGPDNITTLVLDIRV
ncbi:PP2C family protein-serine/threonine phosphatase [Actinomadura sp. 6N118]|uniref:PP2C family protein-serine/threonine phosphatase n=1 Tax=Actinomadura sp. 6N118 TaxID=3375151 RepID=UPI0037B2B50C